MSNPNERRRQIEQLRNIQALISRRSQDRWQCPDCNHRPFDPENVFGRLLLVQPDETLCQTCVDKIESTGSEVLEFWAPRGIDNGHPGE